MAAKTGATLVSVTVIVKLVSAEALALSVTRIVTGNEPGPSVSVGVQVKTPVVGLIAAPVGAATRLKASVSPGRSASVALEATVSSVV